MARSYNRPRNVRKHAYSNAPRVVTVVPDTEVIDALKEQLTPVMNSMSATDAESLRIGRLMQENGYRTTAAAKNYLDGKPANPVPDAVAASVALDTLHPQRTQDRTVEVPPIPETAPTQGFWGSIFSWMGGVWQWVSEHVWPFIKEILKSIIMTVVGLLGANLVFKGLHSWKPETFPDGLWGATGVKAEPTPTQQPELIGLERVEVPVSVTVASPASDVGMKPKAIEPPKVKGIGARSAARSAAQAGEHYVQPHISHSRSGRVEHVAGHMAKNPAPHKVPAHISHSRTGAKELVAAYSTK